MDATLITFLASISACNARIEGMKAENLIQPHPIYGEKDFIREAHTLECIAEAARKYGNA